jgi:hypothetical protein
MRTLKRDRSILHCRTCGKDKPCRDFYESNLSICMDCKRKKVNEYKARTGYNKAYRTRMEAA